MLTQLLFANKLLLDCITEQKKKKERKAEANSLLFYLVLGDR